MLRPFEEDDTARFCLIASEEDIQVIPKGTPPATQRVLAQSWIAYSRSGMRAGTSYQFAVVQRSSRLIIGAVGLVDVDLRQLIGHLGFWIAGRFRRNGYAKEGCRAVLQFAFRQLQLKRVAAKCEAHNTPSVRLLTQLGFQRTVGLRRHTPSRGFKDELIYWELSQRGS